MESTLQGAVQLQIQWDQSRAGVRLNNCPFMVGNSASLPFSEGHLVNVMVKSHCAMKF